jgi:hypothetical protein
MTTELKFREIAVQYLIDNPEELLDTGTFKKYLIDTKYPFDAEDMRSIGYGNGCAWEQKVGNIICHKSLNVCGIISFRFDEQPPTDKHELAIWIKPKPRYYFVREGSQMFEGLKTIPGITFLNNIEPLPTSLFG